MRRSVQLAAGLVLYGVTAAMLVLAGFGLDPWDVRDTFASAGHPRPDLAASRYVMLRDGATTAGYLGDPSQARDAFDRSVADLLRFTGEPAETDDPAAEPPSSEAAWTPARTPAQSQ